MSDWIPIISWGISTLIILGFCFWLDSKNSGGGRQ